MAMVDPKFDASSKLGEECALSTKEAEPSHSVSFVPSIENSISVHSQVSAVAEQGCTEIVPRNEDQNSFHTQGKVKIPSSTSYLSSGFQSVASARCHNSCRISSGFQSVSSVRCYDDSDTIPSLSGEGQVRRGNVMKQRVTGWVDRGSNCLRDNRTYSSCKNIDFSHENFRGPRANRDRSSSLARKGKITNLLHRDNYNKPDFQIEYEEAKFFIIKSYSEDDVHKSIKYNVWASTPSGNKKLDAAFWAADSVVERGLKCPIFLFFSVNSSGQFLGLAEMVGPVDFNKDMDFWQEEIWNGFFPVKWHIIKDIPSRLFQYITLENNFNNSVTFSRDTQEIWLPQGLRMLQIFKNHQPRTSLLDDFEFYEQRQKSLQAARSKRHAKMDSEFGEDNNSMKRLETAVSNMNMAGKSRQSTELMSLPSSARKFNSHRQPRSLT